MLRTTPEIIWRWIPAFAGSLFTTQHHTVLLPLPCTGPRSLTHCQYHMLTLPSRHYCPKRTLSASFWKLLTSRLASCSYPVCSTWKIILCITLERPCCHSLHYWSQNKWNGPDLRSNKTRFSCTSTPPFSLPFISPSPFATYRILTTRATMIQPTLRPHFDNFPISKHPISPRTNERAEYRAQCGKTHKYLVAPTRILTYSLAFSSTNYFNFSPTPKHHSNRVEYRAQRGKTQFVLRLLSQHHTRHLSSTCYSLFQVPSTPTSIPLSHPKL
jgi:hypothetical protein